MKHLFIKYLGIGIFILMLSSGCSDYLDINADPSVPQKTASENLLPPILAQMVRGEAFDIRYFGLYTQMFASNQASTPALVNFERYGYNSGSDAAGEKWRSHYWSIGQNIDLILSDASTTNSFDLTGAAKAIRAWSWQSTSDVHGEMILKQAWEANRYVFDFDTQDKVYDEVVRLSNDALSDLGKATSVRLVKPDLVYKGNIDKWKKFIYGNLARNANHISAKPAYKPADVIKYCDLALSSNLDNFAVPHAATVGDNANFFGPLRNNLAVFRPSAMIVKMLNGTTFAGVKDPRLTVMIPVCRDTMYRGLDLYATDPNHATTPTAAQAKLQIPNLWGYVPGSISTILSPGQTGSNGRWIFSDAEPHYLMTYAEILFIKAEAAFRKGDKPTALDAYKKGIEAHLDFCKIAAAAKTTYLTSAAVQQTSDALTLSDIMQQKYIALWGHGALEAWVDMRRFQYDPAIYTAQTILKSTDFFPDNGGPNFPYRVRPRYNSEYVWNLESLKKFGGDKQDFHTTKPWFLLP
jgi:Starch-binding associating with outer membrane